MSRANIEIGDTSDLDAIYRYVESLRAQNPNPVALIEINNFDKWYQGLSWYQKQVMTNDTFDEAVRRRFQINAAMGKKIPKDWVPADAPNTPPPPPPLIPPEYKVAVGVGAGATLLLVFLKKIHVI